MLVAGATVVLIAGCAQPGPNATRGALAGGLYGDSKDKK
jgi:hypothetical protein